MLVRVVKVTNQVGWTEHTWGKRRNTKSCSYWRPRAFRTWVVREGWHLRNRTAMPNQRSELFQSTDRTEWYWKDWSRIGFSVRSMRPECQNRGSSPSDCLRWRRSPSSRRWICCIRGASRVRSKRSSFVRDRRRFRDWTEWCIWAWPCIVRTSKLSGDLGRCVSGMTRAFPFQLVRIACKINM